MDKTSEFINHLQRQYGIEIIDYSVEIEHNHGIVTDGYLRVVVIFTDDQIEVINSKCGRSNLDNYLTKAWMNAKMNRKVMPWATEGNVIAYDNRIEIKSSIPIIELFISYILE